MQIGKQLVISINDNGTGFMEENVRPFANGLGNMKKRMKALGGTIELKDTVGVTVILTAPVT